MKKIKKYLGIDYGTKRIGLALASNEANLAVPFLVVKNINEIIKIVKEEEIDKIIIGKPLKMRGKDLEISNDYLEFLSLLKKKINIPINTIDERLTSKASDALSGDKKTKAPRDAIAAMLILQNYIDTKKTNRDENNEI